MGLVASLVQLKCTKYFRDDLTIAFEDAQTNMNLVHICEDSSEMLLKNVWFYRVYQ